MEGTPQTVAWRRLFLGNQDALHPSSTWRPDSSCTDALKSSVNGGRNPVIARPILA